LLCRIDGKKVPRGDIQVIACRFFPFDLVTVVPPWSISTITPGGSLRKVLAWGSPQQYNPLYQAFAKGRELSQNRMFL